MTQRYQGSRRQQKQRRRTRIVAAVLATALVLPIIISAIAAISR